MLLVANHVSVLDPLACARLVFDAGRLPHFLAKQSVFKGFAGTLLRSAGQIPVARFSADAHAALDAAKADLDAGNLVVIYPEGSVTRDPDWWPMQARTGVARLALTTDAVVLPVAQWGPQRVHDYHRKKLHLRFRTPADYLVGEPVDLSAAARRRSAPAARCAAELLRETTDLIMTRVRDQLAELRDEPAAADLPPAAAARAARRRAGERGVTRAAVLGAGSWGTTFAKVLADAGCEVTLHARRPELAEAITDDAREPRLPARRPAARRRSAPPADPAEALDGADDRRPRRARRSRCATTSTRWAPLLPADATAAVADEGHRARHRPSG